MKKLTIGLFVLALLAVPAQAQRRGAAAAPPTPEELQKKREAAELDQQYKDALRRGNNDSAQTKVDPWANMRGGANEPKR
jgi:hypothetical protein